MMEELTAKITSLILLFALTLLAGLVPVLVSKWLMQYASKSPSSVAKANFIISILNCFAGGVFLGTTLLHLFPEVNEATESILAAINYDGKFPVGEFIVSIGFFLVMILEHLVMNCQHHHVDFNDSPFESGRATPHTHDHVSHNPLPSPKKSQEPTAYNVDSNSSLMQGAENKKYGSLSKDETAPLVQPNESKSKTKCKHHSALAILEQQEDNCVHLINPSHHQKHHHTSQVQGIRTFILLLSLSIHTVFEGLAIGLQSGATNVWSLFSAVVIHKVIIAFTMSISFTNTIDNKKVILLFITIFSLMSPLGVGIGTVVSALKQNDLSTNIASGVLQGIAAGTFLYVTFFEVLQKEIGQDHSLLKVFGVIVGYIVIVMLNLFG